MAQSKEELIRQIETDKIIAIVRGIYDERADRLAESLLRGGVRLMEFTFVQNDPFSCLRAARCIERLCNRFQTEMCFGAGTVMAPEQVDLAAGTGARFIISPDTNEEVVRLTLSRGVVSIPGALTPTEIAAAHRLGADFVKVFPADFALRIKFKPIREPGLAMLFFSASGREGQPLFDPSLAPRTGEYPQYHHGDINAFHLSFFRRKEPDERAFHTCNLRKSYGFYLVAQGADPIPDVADATDFYELTLVKQAGTVSFSVNDLEVLRFTDDGYEYGPLLGEGCIGLRQLAPMAGEYKDLRVYKL